MADIIVDRTTYIKFGDDEPISTGIAEGSMLIDKILFTDDIIPGSFASSRFEIQIYGVGNVAGKDIKVYQVENEQQIDLFTGRVQSAKLDNAGYYRNIVAYDLLYFYARKNVAEWFNNTLNNQNQYRSAHSCIVDLMNYLNIPRDSTRIRSVNFSGASTVFRDSTVVFEKIALRDMLRYILEPNGLIGYINESGQFSVYKPSFANSVNLIGKYDVNESTFEEYEVQPFQHVKVLNIDNSIVTQATVSGVTSGISYELAYNPILLRWYNGTIFGGLSNETYAEEAVNQFIARAGFQAYTPCDLHMIVSDMSIKLGDLVTTSKGVSYVSEIIYSGPMLVEQEVISRGSQVIEEVEEDYDPVYAYLDNKINETADELTENLEEALEEYEPSKQYLEKVQEFSDTIANGMGLKTITRIDSETGARTVYYYAPDSNGAITNSTFIFTMKSNGFAWTTKWEGTPDASSESHTDPVSGETITTTWQSGISANGNAILKILTAYKISADIIESGEFVIRDLSDPDRPIIHKFSFDDLSASIGEGAITYDVDNGLQINSQVMVATAEAAAQAAVADIEIKDIASTEISYQASANNTSIPSGTWSDTIPSVSAGQYLWTRTRIYYSDHTQQNPSYSDSYSVSRQGENGQDGQDGQNGNDGNPGKGISSITTYYKASTNGSTAPSTSTAWPTTPSSSGFSETNKYLWSYTVTTYSDTTTLTSDKYIIGVWGQKGTDGTDGTDGRGISSIVQQYCMKKTASGFTSVDFPNVNHSTSFNEIRKYKFVPSSSGSLVFESLNSFDTYGYIFNSSGSTLNYNDDGGTDNNFKITYSVTAAVNYYIAARAYSDSNDGKTINATISLSGLLSTDWSEEPPLYAAGFEYYTRDKITWSDNNITYTNEVKSNGLNKAILDANEANTAIGEWCYNNDKTYIDGGKIYTGTVTADALYANTVMTEKILAEDAEIAGTLTFTMNTTSATTSELNAVSNAAYGCDYDYLTTQYGSAIGTIYKAAVAATAKIYKNIFTTKIKAYIDNENTTTMLLTPGGLVVDTQNGITESSIVQDMASGAHSFYGNSANIIGELYVGGSKVIATGTNITAGISVINFPANSYTSDEIQVNLPTAFQGNQYYAVSLTVQTDAYAWVSTRQTTYFKYKVRLNTTRSSSFWLDIHWIVAKYG